ncbi:HDIG domain-containing protein [Candidatus Woesearchaeota archaeon]|nr:HDIG domain-containing protein [Candidatus Woesearchaeota archaeon]
MKHITEKEAISLLKKYSPDERVFKIVLNHVKAVQKKALAMAQGIPGLDLELIKIGSLLHDIGRFKTGPGPKGIRHGVIGGEILRKEGVGQYASIAECHIGAGIRKEDIEKQKLDLPLKDFIPETKEEKIVAQADNYIFGDKEAPFEKVLERFEKELGHDYAERVKRMQKEIDGMKEE